ncbi:hypothetical protein DFP72DRAFT_909813, partial [Ephemerocybe angulata]
MNNTRPSSNATPPKLLTGVSASPVGVNAKCGIPRLNHDGSISNVVNAASGVSVFFVALLIVLCNRRKAALGACSVLFLYPLSFSSFPLVFLLSSISSTSITPPPSRKPIGCAQAGNDLPSLHSFDGRFLRRVDTSMDGGCLDGWIWPYDY